ncbi:MAG: porin, partial [Gammaproteobacteria bacterium]|nr:porin [Gammaproteobacteria bacterium]
MNKKLLATAVAASLAVPVAANAAEVYGRVNNALSMFDSDAPGADTVWDQRNVSSRFGLKGSSDLD